MFKFLSIVFLCILGFLILVGLIAIFYSPPKIKQKPYNIDSLVSLIKKDNAYDIKDVYYNPKDSLLGIAFTNKDNAIKTKTYSTTYFDLHYKTDSIACIDGIALYAYKKGKTIKSGYYKSYLEITSRRAAALETVFREKYCTSYYCSPLKVHIQSLMNDPDSFQPDKLWIEWNGDKTFLVTMTYRGKNAFGGLVLNKASAVVDMDGSISDFKIEE